MEENQKQRNSKFDRKQTNSDAICENEVDNFIPQKGKNKQKKRK